MHTQDPGTFGSAGIYVPTEVGLVTACKQFFTLLVFLILKHISYDTCSSIPSSSPAYHINVPYTGAENCSWESLRNVGGDSIWVAVLCVVPSVSFPGSIAKLLFPHTHK